MKRKHMSRILFHRKFPCSLVTLGIIVLFPLCVSGQLREFEVQEFPASSCQDANDNHCIVIVKSSLTGLTFEGNLGIEKQVSRSQKDTICNILQILPDQKQKIRVTAKKFKETRLEIPRMAAGMCITFFISEKITPRIEGSGSCVVTSSPSGASIRIAELPTIKGETPFRLDNIPSGQYTFILSRNYYKATTCTLSITDKDTITRNFKLIRGDRCLVITSNPSGAQVFIDGNLCGVTPLEVDTNSSVCRPGEHRYRIEKSLFRPDSGIFIGTRDSVAEVNGNLAPRHGLTIKVDPPDAQISISGKTYTGSVEDLDVPVGARCEIVISKQGYDAYRENVWIDKREPVERNVALKKEFEGKALESKQQLLKNLRLGGWVEIYGCAAATPMLLYTPGAPTGVADAGAMFRTSLLFKIIVMNPDWRSGPYIGVSCFGDVIFHPEFFLLDVISIQAGYQFHSRNMRNRIYLDIDGGIKMAGMSKHESNGTIPSLWVPVIYSGRYEFSINPKLSFVATLGGMHFAGLWATNADVKNDFPVKGFLPFFGVGIRTHFGLLSHWF